MRTTRLVSAIFALLAMAAPALGQGAVSPPRYTTRPAGDNSAFAATTGYVDRSAQALINALAGKQPLDSVLTNLVNTKDVSGMGVTLGGQSRALSAWLPLFARADSPVFTGTASMSKLMFGSGSAYGAGVPFPGSAISLGNDLGIGGILRNPTVPGWGISFNLPTATGYRNSMHLTTYVDGDATDPANGVLINNIVLPTYCSTIGGVNCATPVFVGLNAETQVQGGGGTDYWNLLGVLDIQPAGGKTADGGQATSGIVRGNWSGTKGFAGIRAQAENYTGRAAYGVIVGASMTEGTGSAFDNSFEYGVMVHNAATYGVVVGGLEGGNPARLPTFPYAVVNANSTASPWYVRNNGGVSVTQGMTGDLIVSGSGSFGTLSASGTASVGNVTLPTLGAVQMDVGAGLSLGTHGARIIGAGGHLFFDNWDGDVNFRAPVTFTKTVIETVTTTPASSTAPCSVGQHAWDANYEYRCVQANVWKRAALSTW